MLSLMRKNKEKKQKKKEKQLEKVFAMMQDDDNNDNDKIKKENEEKLNKDNQNIIQSAQKQPQIHQNRLILQQKKQLQKTNDKQHNINFSKILIKKQHKSSSEQQYHDQNDLIDQSFKDLQLNIKKQQQQTQKIKIQQQQLQLEQIKNKSKDQHQQLQIQKKDIIQEQNINNNIFKVQQQQQQQEQININNLTTANFSSTPLLPSQIPKLLKPNQISQLKKQQQQPSSCAINVKHLLFQPKSTLIIKQSLEIKIQQKQQNNKKIKIVQKSQKQIQIQRKRDQLLLKKQLKRKENQQNQTNNKLEVEEDQNQQNDQQYQQQNGQNQQKQQKNKKNTTKKIKKVNNYQRLDLKRKYKDRFVGGLKQNQQKYMRNGTLKPKYRTAISQLQMDAGQIYNTYIHSLSRSFHINIDMNQDNQQQYQNECPFQSQPIIIPTTQQSTKHRLTQLINQMFGFKQFRQGQYEVIHKMINFKSTIFISQTASGKSLTYIISSLLMSHTFTGMSIIISPLIALMLDQLQHLPVQIPAVCISSLINYEQREKILTLIKENKVKLLFITPEMLMSDILFHITQFPKINFVCVDEAHCLSQLSSNFRTSYLALSEIVLKHIKYNNPSNTPNILCLTATANTQTTQSLAKKLKISAQNIIISSTTINKNLFITITRQSSIQSKLKSLVDYLSHYQIKRCKSTLIYCRAKYLIEKVFYYLSNSNISSTIFHGQLTNKQKTQIISKFKQNQIKIIITTTALGMGLDFQSLDCIVHFNMTKTLESYVQEIGRAGRRQKRAYCHLFLDQNDYLQQRNYILADQLEEQGLKVVVKEIEKIGKIIKMKKQYYQENINDKKLKIKKQKKQKKMKKNQKKIKQQEQQDQMERVIRKAAMFINQIEEKHQQSDYYQQQSENQQNQQNQLQNQQNQQNQQNLKDQQNQQSHENFQEQNNQHHHQFYEDNKLQIQQPQPQQQQKQIQSNQQPQPWNPICYIRVKQLSQKTYLRQQALLMILIKISQLINKQFNNNDTNKFKILSPSSTQLFTILPLSYQILKLSFFKTNQNQLISDPIHGQFYKILIDLDNKTKKLTKKSKQPKCKKINGSYHINLIDKCNKLEITPIELLTKVYEISNLYTVKIQFVNEVYVIALKNSWDNDISEVKIQQNQQNNHIPNPLHYSNPFSYIMSLLSTPQFLTLITTQFNLIQQTTMTKLNIFYSLAFNYSQITIQQLIKNHSIIPRTLKLPSDNIMIQISKYFKMNMMQFYKQLVEIDDNNDNNDNNNDVKHEQNQNAQNTQNSIQDQLQIFLPTQTILPYQYSLIFQHIKLFFKHQFSNLRDITSQIQSLYKKKSIIQQFSNGKIITRIFIGVNEEKTSRKIYGEHTYWRRFIKKKYKELLNLVRKIILTEQEVLLMM